MSERRKDRSSCRDDKPIRRLPVVATLAFLLAIAFGAGAQEPATDASGWWQSLQGKTGHVTGHLEPRFSLDDLVDGGRVSPDATASSIEPSPQDQATASLIMEWIARAEPLENAQAGYDLRYTEWAQLVGTTATGTITASARPDDAGGYADPPSYLWARHQNLPSLNLCTLGEFVRARLAGRGLEDCQRGRPTAQGEGVSAPQVEQSAAGSRPPAITSASGRTVPETAASDSVEDAAAIVPGDTAVGRIEPVGDVDFYAIDLASQGELTVQFADVPSGLDMAFRILDAGGKQVWPWQTAPQPGAALSAWADIEAAGRYVIEVRDGYNNAASPHDYRMVVLFVPTHDPAEPNDSVETATPLAWGTPVSAHILSVGDVDYYAIELSRQGEVTVTFDAAPPELDMAFRIVDESGGQVWPWQTAEKPGALHSAWADVKSPGRYLIEVRDGYNNARSAAPYRMTATIVETADPAEPNDGIEAATPLALDVPVSAHILPVGDVDYYAIELSRQGEVTVTFDAAPPELDMAFRIVDESGGQVWPWQTAERPGALHSAWADVKSPGRYIIEVRDGYNNARSASPYRVTATIVETADPAEPNDGIETATPLALDVPVSAHILPVGDADLYRLALPAGTNLRVRFANAPDPLDMAFRILDGGGREVHGWRTAPSPGAPFEAVVQLDAGGTYILEVRDGYNNARAAEPYSLIVSAQ